MLQGHVYDYDTEQPISDAVVTAVAGSDVYSDVTGSDGFYSIELPAGIYLVTFTAPGYNSTEETITIPEGSTVTGDIYLSIGGATFFIPWWGWALFGGSVLLTIAIASNKPKE